MLPIIFWQRNHLSGKKVSFVFFCFLQINCYIYYFNPDIVYNNYYYIQLVVIVDYFFCVLPLSNTLFSFLYC